jgi:hypothetical protein
LGVGLCRFLKLDECSDGLPFPPSELIVIRGVIPHLDIPIRLAMALHRAD